MKTHLNFSGTLGQMRRLGNACSIQLSYGVRVYSFAYLAHARDFINLIPVHPVSNGFMGKTWERTVSRLSAFSSRFIPEPACHLNGRAQFINKFFQTSRSAPEGEHMATENAIYRITLTNWEKHNSHQKKGYKATLIPNRFCDDAKLRVLPMTHRWLFLNLVLTCSDMCRNSVELSSKTIRNMLETNLNIVRVLDRMQELQLLTFEKLPLIEENRRNRKESNGIEVVDSYESTSTVVEKSTPVVVGNRKSKNELIPMNEGELIAGLRDTSKSRWAQLYPDETFIRREVLKAFNWYENNPKKKPKTVRGWTAALSSWFERSWPRHLKTLESNKVVGFSEAEMSDILGGRG